AATRRRWDVLVIGAGPAGALAARELARIGHAVLLIDKSAFPRYKVCGGCLNGRALAALAASDLGHLVSAQGGVALRAFRWRTAHQEVDLRMPDGVALSREGLDAALVQAAIEAGAAFLPLYHALLGNALPGSRQVVLRRAGVAVPVEGRVILMAAGLSAAASIGGSIAWRRARIGLGAIAATAPADYRPGTIYMASTTGGYAGLVRVEAGRLEIAAACDRTVLRGAGGPAQWVAGLLREVAWPVPAGMDRLVWRGTPPLTQRARRLAGERVFLIGDSAAYVEPFTGEGMGWALASALAVLPLAARAVGHWEPGLIRAWGRAYRSAIGPQWVCRSVARALRHPLLADACARVLKTVPRLATPLLQRIHAPRPMAPHVL
ncbi:MAG: NAD(P)/FAD-dependent oxidoreductase, partial [Gammaproteobacteria bacterium]